VQQEGHGGEPDGRAEHRDERSEPPGPLADPPFRAHATLDHEALPAGAKPGRSSLA